MAVNHGGIPNLPSPNELSDEIPENVRLVLWAHWRKIAVDQAADRIDTIQAICQSFDAYMRILRALGKRVTRDRIETAIHALGNWGVQLKWLAATDDSGAVRLGRYRVQPGFRQWLDRILRGRVEHWLLVDKVDEALKESRPQRSAPSPAATPQPSKHKTSSPSSPATQAPVSTPPPTAIVEGASPAPDAGSTATPEPRLDEPGVPLSDPEEERLMASASVLPAELGSQSTSLPIPEAGSNEPIEQPVLASPCVSPSASPLPSKPGLDAGPTAATLRSQPSPPPETTPPARTKPRRRSTITSRIAGQRMEAYITARGLGFEEFGDIVGAAGKTLRQFADTGIIQRRIAGYIAKAMGTSLAELLKSD
jgi:hypothetical protein